MGTCQTCYALVMKEYYALHLDWHQRADDDLDSMSRECAGTQE